MANDLAEARDYFLEFTGRADLGTIGGSDNGANNYLNQGQRRLDELSNFQNGYKRYVAKKTAGGYYVALDDCRVIEEVWCSNTEERWKLRKALFEDFLLTYDDIIADIDQGDPYIWTPAKPRTEGTALDNLASFIDYEVDDVTDARCILYGPPNDETVLITVYGKFWSPTLTASTQKTFWTKRPMLLAWAGAYQLEVGYRNTEGARDWMAAIMREINEIDKDVAEEESVNLLEG